MKHHGEDVSIEAVAQADAMLEKGALDGGPVSKWVLRAVGNCRGGACGAGALSAILVVARFFLYRHSKVRCWGDTVAKLQLAWVLIL